MKSLDHVPFIVTGDKGALELAGEQGTLADVAPTVLAILGLPQPEGEFRDLIRSRPDGTSRDDWSFSSRQAIDASAERHQIAIDVHRCNIVIQTICWDSKRKTYQKLRGLDPDSL